MADKTAGSSGLGGKPPGLVPTVALASGLVPGEVLNCGRLSGTVLLTVARSSRPSANAS